MRTIDFVRPTKIEKVVQECSNIRTFAFEDAESLRAAPGQFAMVWLPNVGEFPMSLSLPQGKLASVSVKAMGSGSRSLYECRMKDRIGVRGPYGRPFDLTKLGGKKILLSGGGTGLVPMITLASSLSEENRRNAKIVMGARTGAEIPFLSEAQKILGRQNVYPTTDDGSFGFHGLAHEKVEEILGDRKSRIHSIFACGPEKMMRAIYEIASRNGRNPRLQFSLERIMKCGIGICGSCCINDYVLCRDGPVLDERKLKRASSEFGSYERDKTGKLAFKN